MKKVMVMLACLSFISALPICEKAFAEKDKINPGEQVAAAEATEAKIIETAPIQDPEAGLEEEVKNEEIIDTDS